MKCEQCGRNKAEIVLSVCLDGQTLQSRYLCRACANAQGAAGEVRAQATPGAGAQAIEDLACDTCGLRFGEFCRTGLLGCADCYVRFGEHLVSLLRQTCGPDYFARDFSTKAAQAGDRGLRQQLMELERALQEAVHEERYEAAAHIRDEIQMVKAALGRQ